MQIKINLLIFGKKIQNIEEQRYLKYFVILFREFIMALSAASVVNRLRLVETLFSIFDLDSDGKISKDEMGKMLQTLVEVTNSNRKRRHHFHHHHHHHHHHSNGHNETKEIDLQKRLDDAFNELNTNDDDVITKDEFIEWYIKSGLLSDVKSNEINVPNTSHIQRLDKKSRKIKKQQINTNNKEESLSPRPPQLIRYMSHMSEQKPLPIINDDDNDDIIDDNHLILCQKISSDDTDSHYSKENERWQHLFNSVLAQIRSQRSEEINDRQQEINSNNHNRISHFNSWKQQGEEKLKLEYYRQKSNDGSTSPNIFSIRL